LLRRFCRKDFGSSFERWRSWWEENREGFILPEPAELPRSFLQRGHMLLGFYQSGNVIELDREHKIIWRAQFDRPLRVQKLRDGNLLIVEQGKNRVIEIDLDERVVWEYSPNGQTILDAQALETGNILIFVYFPGTGNGLIHEIDKEKNKLWEIKLIDVVETSFYFRRLDGGNIIAGSGNKIFEYDFLGRFIRRISPKGFNNLGFQPHIWKKLDGGILMASGDGEILEIRGDKRKSIWRYEKLGFKGPVCIEMGE
jgi:hypothetical protein